MSDYFKRRREEQTEAKKVTEKVSEDPSLLRGMWNTVGNMAEAGSALAQGATSTVTGGGSEAADVYLNAAYRNMFGSDRKKKTFKEFREEVRKEQEKFRDKNKTAYITGEVAGAVPLMGVGAGAGLLGRTGASAALGAADVLGKNAARGNIDSVGDALLSAGEGALAGAVGEGLGSAAGWAGRKAGLDTLLHSITGKNAKWGSKAAGDRQAGRDLLEQTVDVPGVKNSNIGASAELGVGTNAADAISAATPKMGPDDLISDVDPRFNRPLSTLVADATGANKGLRSGIANTAADRITNMQANADLIIGKHVLDDPQATKFANVKEFTDEKARINAGYDMMLKNPKANKPFEQRSNIIDSLEEFYDPDASTAVAKTRDALINEVEEGFGAANSPDSMTPNQLLKFKKHIDEKINAYYASPEIKAATSYDQIEYLTKAKKYINDQLGLAFPSKRGSPGYKTYAEQFSLNANADEAFKAGEDYMKSNAKYSAKEMDLLTENMSAAEKANFTKGATAQFLNKSRSPSSTLSTVLKGNSPEAQKLRYVIGDEKYDAFVDDIVHFDNQMTTAKTVQGSMGMDIPDPIMNPFGQSVYGAAGVTAAAQGHLNSAMFPLGRAMSVATDPADIAQQQATLRLLRQKGGSSAQSMLDYLTSPNTVANQTIGTSIAAPAAIPTIMEDNQR